MALSTLVINPEQSSFQSTAAGNAFAARLDGGRSATRSQPRGSTTRVSATWSLSITGYTYFMAFYRTKARRGSEPFYIALPTHSFSLPLHKAWFVPGTLKVTLIGGTRFKVSATLEVEP